MEKKTFFRQFKSILTIGFFVFWGCAGVVYGGYEGGKEGFAESDIAKCLYFLMAGMVIVIVRRLRKKKNHVENNVSF